VAKDENEVQAYVQAEVQMAVSSAIDDFAADVDTINNYNISPTMKRRNTRMSKRFVNEDETAGSKRKEQSRFTGYAMFDVVTPPYNFDYLANIYESNVHNFAAVNAKTFNVVGLGYDFKPTSLTISKLDEAEGNQAKLDKLRKKLEKIKREHFAWLDSLNQEDSFSETLLKVYKDLEVLGNGYFEIGRTSSGEIAYLGHIPAGTIRIRRMRDGYIQLVNGKHSVFFRNFGDQDTPNPLGNDPKPNEILHLSRYSPRNDYYGVPDIVSALAAVAGSRYAQNFNIDYFEHRAAPRYMIVSKGAPLSAAAQNTIHEFFNSKLKGKNHRSVYIPLPADDLERKNEIKFEPIEAGIQDASFIKYKENNRDEILSAHRVPISKISVAAGASLAAARDADKTFKEQVTRPSQDLVEFKINQIIKTISDVYEFKLNELSLTDEDTQSKIYERYLRNQTMTPNEVRQELGLPGIDGGDDVIELKPQVAADAANNASGSDARGRERSAGASDSAGESRNPKGEGRQTQ
jgi:PBSX family phage portal protein